MNNDSYRLGIELWAKWTEMWNGRPELALTLVGPRFVLHLPQPENLDPTSINSPASVEQWVRAHRARFDRLTFRYEAGPFVDTRAGVVAGPWVADSAIAGKPRVVCGMDTISFRDGKIIEYWTVSKQVDAPRDWTKSG